MFCQDDTVLLAGIWESTQCALEFEAWIILSPGLLEVMTRCTCALHWV